MGRRYAVPSALLASLLLHGSLLGAGGYLLVRSLQRVPTETVEERSREVEVTLTDNGLELPTIAGLEAHGPAVQLVPNEVDDTPGGGGDRAPRPDMTRRGRGGSNEVTDQALNLADSDDGLTLNRDPLNRFDRSQVQRLRTAAERRSEDDRRATPNPMELSFLASGSGERAVRRPPAQLDPAAGVASGGIPARAGGQLGQAAAVGDDVGAHPGGDVVGDSRVRPAQGIEGGSRGHDYRMSARVVMARPMVPPARPAVPSAERGRPNDTVDSSQEVASRVASLIHASTAGGRAGFGPGGTSGPDAPGSDGMSGPGSRSGPNGFGPGTRRDDTSDPRLVGYARSVLRRVRWDDAFPEWAISQGRGGVAIIGLTVLPDGRVANLRVIRASGVVEFDKNLLAAINRAAPFDPLPASLQTTQFPLHLRFDALNPAVGREGPGPGRRY